MDLSAEFCYIVKVSLFLNCGGGANSVNAVAVNIYMYMCIRQLFFKELPDGYKHRTIIL